MSERPAASVLVSSPGARPVGAAPLGRTLDSLLAQTRDDLEALVLCEAGDAEALDSATIRAARDPRISVHRGEEGADALASWRRLAALARAPVVGLLSPGDAWAPDFLEEALPHLVDRRVGFVYSSVRIEEAAGVAARAPVRFVRVGPAKRRTYEFLEETYRRIPSASVPSSPSCALFRTADLRRVLSSEPPGAGRRGFFGHAAGPGLALYLQACRSYPRYAHLARPRAFPGQDPAADPQAPARGRAVALALFLEAAEARLGWQGGARARLAGILSALGEEELAREAARGLGPIGRLRIRGERRRAAREVLAAARSGR